jgi:hypothetical protein
MTAQPGGVWAVDLPVPSALVEYKYLQVCGVAVLWEPCPNRRITLPAPSGSAATLLHVQDTWGMAASRSLAELPRPSVLLQVQVPTALVAPGSSLCVDGLDGWGAPVRLAQQQTRDAASSHTSFMLVRLGVPSSREYKYLLRRQGQPDQWEAGRNRSLQPAAKCAALCLQDNFRV